MTRDTDEATSGGGEALSDERIAEARVNIAEARKRCRPGKKWDRVNTTTLALIAERAEMLALLKRVDDGAKHGVWLIETHCEDGAILLDAVTAFLERRRAAER